VHIHHGLLNRVKIILIGGFGTGLPTPDSFHGGNVQSVRCKDGKKTGVYTLMYEFFAGSFGYDYGAGTASSFSAS
jgi:hypothetical protein